MKKDNQKQKKSSGLRKEAEKKLRPETVNIEKLSDEEVCKLAHELQVHQIELDMQNEELRKAQEELTESRDEYSHLYDFAPVGYFTVNEKGLITKANLTFAKMLGRERSLLINKLLSGFIAWEDRNKYYLYHKHVFDEQSCKHCELRLMRRDGTQFYVHMDCAVVQEGDSKECRTVATDITGQKFLMRAMEMLKMKAETANIAKSEFLANISHEMKTPLNAVIGFSELLKGKSFGEINEKQEGYVNHIHKSGKCLLDMINDLIDISEVDAGRTGLKLEYISLPLILNDTVDMFKPAALKKNMEIETHIYDELTTITADEAKLKRIVGILIDNAVKFTPDGGMIKVAAGKAKDSVQISFTDTGIGIKPEEKEHIFERFTQADGSSTRKYGGTGIGLALAKRFVEMHGGKIWAVSPPGKDKVLEEGKGSSFIFTIPYH